MKSYVVIAVSCAICLAGGWALAARHYQHRVAELQRQLTERQASVTPTVVSEPTRYSRADERPAETPPPLSVDANVETAAVQETQFVQPPWWNQNETNRPDWERRRGTPEERAAWQERMATQMIARAERLRTNFFIRAKLTEPEAERFDVLITAMNVRLQDQIKEWASIAETGDMSRSELRARVMKEVNGIFVLTYDEMDRNMPEDWRTQTDEDFNLQAFADPTIMQELRPLIGRRGMGMGWGGGGTNNSQPSGARVPP